MPFLKRPLPNLTDPVVIDGTSQPGYSGTPLIELNGAGAGSDGLVVTAGNSTVMGLVINRFSGTGIVLESNGGDLIEENYIGTDSTGTVALGNSGNGVYSSGGANTIADNVISGNAQAGVKLDGNSNIVQGNYIGTTAAGTAALGNDGNGLLINGAFNTVGGSTVGAGNLISANQNVGDGGGQITTFGVWTVIQGNFLSTDITGMVALSDSGGLGIYTNSNDNWIGGSSASATGNVPSGVGSVPWQTTSDVGNLISGNQGGGVQIGGLGNTVQGNFIGTDVSGRLPFPCGNGFTGNGDGTGVTTFGSNTLIGGAVAGAGNVIAFNTSDGLLMASGIGNTILGNSIHDNAGLGIDLSNGADEDQTAPVLTFAATTRTGLTIHGTLSSTPNSMFRLEFFSNPSPDPFGYGEGQTYLGYASIFTGVDGTATFDVPVGASSLGEWLSATATDEVTGNTSGFSNSIIANSPPTAYLAGSTSGVLYQPLTFDLSASDLSVPVQNGGFSYSINWGDQTSNSVNGGSSGSTEAHQYSAAGIYTITLTATATIDGGMSAPVTTMVTVSALPQLENGTLAIPGTVGNDTFTLKPVLPSGAAAYSMKVALTTGTTTTVLGTFAIPSEMIQIYNSPGVDAVTLNGSANTDTFSPGIDKVRLQAAVGTPQTTAFTVGLNGITSVLLKGASSDGAAVTGMIDGNGGANNTLDYSLYTTGIYVNLQTLQATGTGGIAVSSIQNVTGGLGNDILVGDGNANKLTETGGRNLVIGGSGSDTLTAGSGGDLLIADSTGYDTNVAVLDAILAEWTSADTFAQRVAYLSDATVASGFANRHNGMYFLLPNSTVFNDSAKDTLTGGGGKRLGDCRHVG